MSVDSFLGLPFNIASYALLCHILAELVGAHVGDLIFSGGDCHIYLNHLNEVNQLLSNEPLDLPILVMPEIRELAELHNLTPSMFKLDGYKSHGKITAEMAV